jgi:hypothetical protein
MAAAALAEAPPAPPVLPYRVGHGFDLHRLAEGYKLIIGGVEIPHTKGCEAHSDGARRARRRRLHVAARGERQGEPAVLSRAQQGGTRRGSDAAGWRGPPWARLEAPGLIPARLLPLLPLPPQATCCCTP